MLVTAGPKGCKAYRNGALVTLPLGTPLPEMLELSPMQLKARIDQGIIEVDFKADDGLVEARNDPSRRRLADGEGEETRDTAPAESPTQNAKWLVAETARGFTAHLSENDKKFLCGRAINKKKIVEMDSEDIDKCSKCLARAE